MLWISILFSILHISQQVRGLAGSAAQNDFGDPTQTKYLDRAKEALIVGDYSTGLPYSVEASLIIAMWIYYQRVNRETEGWVIMGVCARLAMKQGYHRDPSVLKSLSPFEGEMRRRVFFFIETFDLLLSMQGGLPPMINSDECDTRAPSNLVDADFNETSEGLPPSRPETDHTPMLYFRYKSRIAKVFQKVYRRILTLGRFEYDEVMRLDRQLRSIREGIPPSLRFKSMASSVTDDSYMIVCRSHCEQMYLKGLCILHRYFLTHGHDRAEYEYSRQTCINAALDMMDIQAELYTAIQAQGQFSQDKWMTTQITLHDFLLVAMILCVETYRSSENRDSRLLDSALEVRKYDSLRRAHDIWLSQAKTVDEARRASKVLSALLAKIPAPKQEQSEKSRMPAELPTPSKTPDVTSTPSILLPAANDSFDVHATLTPPAVEAPVGDQVSLSVNPMDSFNVLFGQNDSFDWVYDLTVEEWQVC